MKLQLRILTGRESEVLLNKNMFSLKQLFWWTKKLRLGGPWKVPNKKIPEQVYLGNFPVSRGLRAQIYKEELYSSE